MPTSTACIRKGIYLTALAIVILLTRPMSGRLGDTFGYRRVFLPCLVLISVGLSLLMMGGTRGWLLRRAPSRSAPASARPIRRLSDT